MHTFLGMKIRYLNNRRIQINIEEVQEFREDIYQLVTSPTERWLFKVGKFRELKVNMLETFHSVVMKLLWIS